MINFSEGGANWFFFVVFLFLNGNALAEDALLNTVSSDGTYIIQVFLFFSKHYSRNGSNPGRQMKV